MVANNCDKKIDASITENENREKLPLIISIKINFSLLFNGKTLKFHSKSNFFVFF
jgi:hypothetical protein